MDNGTRASYTYDDAGRIVVLANIRSSGTTISSFEYSYDGAGNRLRVVEANGDRVTWTYNNTYQLTRERRSGANAYDITYTYDEVGNRLTKEENSAVTTYAYDAANELMTSEDGSGVTTYTYDAAGNMAASVNPSDEARTYSWDYESRLAAVELPSSAVSTFTYRADGLQVQKEDSACTTKFVWDGRNVLLETDGDGDTVAEYTLAPAGFGMLLAQRRGGATKFFHFDALGSTDRLTNAAQAVSDSYLYEAFGKIIASSGSTANPFKYVGRLGYYFDPDLDQYYLRARWYDPATGRFVSHDAATANAYGYCLSPPNCADPRGKLAITISVPVFGVCYNLLSFRTFGVTRLDSPPYSSLRGPREEGNFCGFAVGPQTGRNSQRLGDGSAQARDAGRAGRMPPGLGFDLVGVLERERQQLQQTIGHHTQCDVALLGSNPTLPTVSKSSMGFQFVERVLDFEPGRIQFQQSHGGHRQVGGEEDVHLLATSLREDDHLNGHVAERPTGYDDADKGLDGHRLAVNMNPQPLPVAASPPQLPGRDLFAALGLGTTLSRPSWLRRFEKCGVAAKPADQGHMAAFQLRLYQLGFGIQVVDDHNDSAPIKHHSSQQLHGQFDFRLKRPPRRTHRLRYEQQCSQGKTEPLAWTLFPQQHHHHPAKTPHPSPRRPRIFVRRVEVTAQSEKVSPPLLHRRVVDRQDQLLAQPQQLGQQIEQRLAHLAARPAATFHEHIRRRPVSNQVPPRHAQRLGHTVRCTPQSGVGYNEMNEMIKTGRRKTRAKCIHKHQKSIGSGHLRGLLNWNVDISCKRLPRSLYHFRSLFASQKVLKLSNLNYSRIDLAGCQRASRETKEGCMAVCAGAGLGGKKPGQISSCPENVSLSCLPAIIMTFPVNVTFDIPIKGKFFFVPIDCWCNCHLQKPVTVRVELCCYVIWRQVDVEVPGF